jgi:hypothetical protein
VTLHKLLTRAELNALDSYAKGVKVPEIAQALKRSESWTWRTLRFLHISNPLTHRGPYAKLLPDDSPLRCQCCGILLSEAASMDGPGDGNDCRYCICLKAGINLYEPLPIQVRMNI